MNRYDEKYIFRRADESDIEDIVAFMDQEWKKDGILSNAEFLKYEFGAYDGINFILAIHKERKEIQGLWGYYYFSKNESVRDVAGGPWKVKQSPDNIPFLGNEIMLRAKEIIGYRVMLGVGDKPNTSGMYHRRIRKDVVDKLNHYYLLNDEMPQKIAEIKEVPVKKEKFAEESKYEFRKITAPEEIENEFWDSLSEEAIPYKDKWYIEKRFFNHPVYKYHLVGICMDNQIKALMIFRKIDVNDSSVLRMVDYIGNKDCIQWCQEFIVSYMKQLRCEYVDFCNYGIPEKYLENAGFVKRTEEDVNIIPHYFEPFVQKNVDIYFSSPIADVTICKADGDQDRPNFI